MNSIIKYFGKNKNLTLLNYLLTYFILFNIVFAGFFIAVRGQLKSIYFEDIRLQAEKRLSNIEEQFLNNLNSVNQVQFHLSKNIDLVLSRYNTEGWYIYEAANKLNEYASGNTFIDSICYIDHKHNTFLSSGKHIKPQNDGVGIYADSRYIDFPLEDFKSSNNNQLILLSDAATRMLLYLPYNNNIRSYTIFYIINSKELHNILKSGMSASISAIGLIDDKKQLVEGIHSSSLIPYLTNKKQEADQIYSVRTLSNHFSIAALLSNDAMLTQVNAVFQNTYIPLLLIAAAGVLFILWAMRITYWPLHKLTRKLVPIPLPNKGYVEQIDYAFSNARTENRQLLEKIKYYHLFMQNSILDTIIKEHNHTDINDNINIDQFFQMEPDHHIFVIMIGYIKNIDDTKSIRHYLIKALPEGCNCAVLVKDSRNATFILQYTGLEQNKDEVMHLLINELYEEYKCLLAISNSSESPLEIPSLYENALAASKYWNHMPVVTYNEVASLIQEDNHFIYPYAQLDSLSISLKAPDFINAGNLIRELFGLADKASVNETPFPEFFVRCVLIDILTNIIHYMNRLNVKFHTYCDLYFETLYLCRSCPYLEKREEILTNTKRLLDIYEQEHNNTAIHTDQLRQLVADNYTSPDFSITTLADHFTVSIAYMSYIFKKKFDRNFSDYLWDLRMEKAKNLLAKTDMTIDTISLSVGYLNTSSFRRKFKQETGITPSQYRHEH